MARDRASRPEAKPVRLFVALEIPDGAKRAVEVASRPWRDEFPAARWVPRQNWHVTLKFLGWTYPRLVRWVHERIATAAGGVGSFETHLTGLGAFPSPRRARVLWAGLDDASGRMSELAQTLDAALSDEFRSEIRPFTPHLTIARSDPPLRLPDGFVETPVDPVVFAVERVTLFRSHLQRPAPRYEPLHEMPLGAGERRRGNVRDRRT